MALSYGFDLGDKSGVYTAEQFSDANAQIIGDVVARYGSMFQLVLASGMAVTLAAGLAYVSGRWIRTNEAMHFTLAQSYLQYDRDDAIALRLDYAARTITPVMLTGIDPENPQRSSAEYIKYLYIIHIRRGTGELLESDITDVRNVAQPLSDTDLTRLNEAFQYFVTGLDAWEAAQLARFTTATTSAQQAASDVIASVESTATGAVDSVQSTAASAKAVITDAATTAKSAITSAASTASTQATTSTSSAISQATATVTSAIDTADDDIETINQTINTLLGLSIGTLTEAVNAPDGDWLLCDGSAVPAAYTDLIALIGSTLPRITSADDRLATWICATESR